MNHWAKGQRNGGHTREPRKGYTDVKATFERLRTKGSPALEETRPPQEHEEWLQAGTSHEGSLSGLLELGLGGRPKITAQQGHPDHSQALKKGRFPETRLLGAARTLLSQLSSSVLTQCHSTMLLLRETDGHISRKFFLELGGFYFPHIKRKMMADISRRNAIAFFIKSFSCRQN